MRTLNRLWRRLWDKYPQCPLVYVCCHNGVTGVVRADDLDDEIRRVRSQEFDHKYGLGFKEHGHRAWLLNYRQVFLFSDMNMPEISNCVGTLSQMRQMLNGCFVEHRDFRLPPIKVGQEVWTIAGPACEGIGVSSQLVTQAPSLADAEAYLKAKHSPRWLSRMKK